MPNYVMPDDLAKAVNPTPSIEVKKGTDTIDQVNQLLDKGLQLFDKLVQLKEKTGGQQITKNEAKQQLRNLEHEKGREVVYREKKPIIDGRKAVATLKKFLNTLDDKKKIGDYKKEIEEYEQSGKLQELIVNFINDNILFKEVATQKEGEGEQ